jgi:hypothetical protein
MMCNIPLCDCICDLSTCYRNLTDYFSISSCLDKSSPNKRRWNSRRKNENFHSDLTDGTMKHLRTDISRLPYDVSPQQELPINTGKGESSNWNIHYLSENGQLLVLKRDDVDVVVFSVDFFFQFATLPLIAQSIHCFFFPHFNRFISIKSSLIFNLPFEYEIRKPKQSISSLTDFFSTHFIALQHFSSCEKEKNLIRLGA